MSRLGTTFATLVERTRRAPRMNDDGEIGYTERQLNEARALGIVITPGLAEDWVPPPATLDPPPEEGLPMGERVAFDPLDIESVIAKHRRLEYARKDPPLEGVACACDWWGRDHDQHLAGLITALAQPVPEVIRQTLTAVEIRLFGAYLIDPITGVDSAKQRQKIWETT